MADLIKATQATKSRYKKDGFVIDCPNCGRQWDIWKEKGCQCGALMRLPEGQKPDILDMVDGELAAQVIVKALEFKTMASVFKKGASFMWEISKIKTARWMEFILKSTDIQVSAAKMETDTLRKEAAEVEQALKDAIKERGIELQKAQDYAAYLENKYQKDIIPWWVAVGGWIMTIAAVAWIIYSDFTHR